VSGPRTILVADDDKAVRTVVDQALAREGYVVRSTSNAATLWGWIADGEGDLVITDVVMPDENGLDMLPRIKQARPVLPIIVMSAHSTLLTAVKATERGAYEYLPKPFDLNELLRTVKSALSLESGAAPVSTEAAFEIDDQLPFIGRSPVMQDIYRIIARLTSTDLTALIIGESGTGKEVVARALHMYSKRSDKAFVAVNMAAIPRELVESELFGHEKGAFTGANSRHSGRFEQAEGGTLFLDEIGDMPLEAQTRLLRVLQQGEFTPVGGRTPRRADVRIIAATHRDLRQLVNQGLFREDLFYRINVVPIRIPPLRDRSEDVPDLVRHFLAVVADEGLPAKTIDGAAMARLASHSWPGNVRELENLVRRLAVLYSDEVIGVDIIDSELSEPAAARGVADGEGLGATVERQLQQYFAAHKDSLPTSGLYGRVLREVERPLIALTLSATRGNQLKAARVLGLNRNTLRKKLRELDIPVGRGAGPW
jgi:two-component system, NtrC family, nitrogen regulation response regulator GlnG